MCVNKIMIRRENELVFSKMDLIRFTRYIINKELSKGEIERKINEWTMGRYKWIEDK